MLMTFFKVRFLRSPAMVALLAVPCGSVLLAQTTASTSPASSSLDLPPLTFHFKEANSSFVSSGLAEQLHLPVTVAANTPLSARGRAGATAILVSADAEQLPFWDAIALLQRENLAVRINDRPIPQVRDCIRQGPFVAQLNSVTLESTVFPQDDGELNPAAGDMKNPVLHIGYFVAADPRLNVVLRNPGLSSVSDDAGHTVAIPETKSRVSPNLWSDTNSPWVRFPANFGKSLTLKGQAEFTIQLSESRLTIPDIQKQTTPVSFHAGKTAAAVAISNFTGDPLAFTLSANAIGTASFPPVLTCSVFDATETLLITRTLTSAGTTTFSFTATGRGIRGAAPHIPVPPFHLTLSAPAQTQTVLFPYEFKNISLPN